MKIIIKAFSLLILFVVFSCDNGGGICLSNQQSVQTGFYSNKSSTEVDSTVKDVSIYAVGKKDSVYSLESFSKGYLPLSMMHDTTSYVIQIQNLKDTITFVHKKELSYVSEECGFVFRFDLDTVLYTDISIIDTIVIAEPSIVYNENFENVKIYLY